MKITKEFLKRKSACFEGVKWFLSQKETNGIKIIKKLIAENRLSWAGWLIVRLMNYKQCVSYAVYASEQVIEIYEKKHPNDNRPRLAIEAAKKCIKSPSKNNKSAAANAAYAAANAADAAAYAAADAEANAAANAAANASNAAANAAAMKIKILTYGIKLMEGKK